MITKFGKNKVKYNLFEQTKDCKKNFYDLKQKFIIALVLAYFNHKLKMYIESNSSNFVIADIFSQMHKRVLRLVAYFSKKLTLDKCNYMIYNKKLLVIVKSLKYGSQNKKMP